MTQGYGGRTAADNTVADNTAADSAASGTAPHDIGAGTAPTGPHAATHGEVVATQLASGQRPREPITLTALFDDPDAVDRTLDALYAAGTPRDLVEVVVSREAAARFYGSAAGPGRRRPRPPGRETFRYAGIGGLTGFVTGVVIGLVMVAMPGIDAPGGHYLVAVAGPNETTIGGAALGALVGFFRRQQPDPRFARAAEASGAIVLAVSTRGEREAALLTQLLERQGGRDVRVEPPVAGRRAALFR